MEKKEIGKLLELLNEYDTDIKWTAGMLSDRYTSNQLFVISKQYGFIEWLVDNDKIDREKFGNSETKSSKYSDFELSYDTPREDYTNILLMELSISDTPIEDLISYLK